MEIRENGSFERLTYHQHMVLTVCFGMKVQTLGTENVQ
jgi:hypothetical protein